MVTVAHVDIYDTSTLVIGHELQEANQTIGQISDRAFAGQFSRLRQAC